MRIICRLPLSLRGRQAVAIFCGMVRICTPYQKIATPHLGLAMTWLSIPGSSYPTHHDSGSVLFCLGLYRCLIGCVYFWDDDAFLYSPFVEEPLASPVNRGSVVTEGFCLLFCRVPPQKCGGKNAPFSQRTFAFLIVLSRGNIPHRRHPSIHGRSSSGPMSPRTARN